MNRSDVVELLRALGIGLATAAEALETGTEQYLESDEPPTPVPAETEAAEPPVPPPPPQPEAVAAPMLPAVEPAAAALPAPTADELDADGMPWDSRIHTEAHTKVKAGTWKVKRGTDPALVAQVKAELLPAAPAADPAPPAAAAPPVSAPETAAALQVPPWPAPETAAAPPEQPAPPAPSTDAPPQAAITYPEFMAKVTERMRTHNVTPDELTKISQSLGLTSIVSFSERTDLMPEGLAKLEALCSSRG